MKRLTRIVLMGAVLAAGPLWQSLMPAQAAPGELCQYQLGDKVATIACDTDPRSQPGMAGNMPEDRGPGSAIWEFEQEDLRRQQEVLQSGGRSGWYPGCNTVPMCVR